MLKVRVTGDHSPCPYGVGKSREEIRFRQLPIFTGKPEAQIPPFKYEHSSKNCQTCEENF